MSKRKEQVDRLSHVDEKGNARMVDVGDKKIQKRRARASGMIHMSSATIRAIREDKLKKGNVLATSSLWQNTLPLRLLSAPQR